MLNVHCASDGVTDYQDYNAANAVVHVGVTMFIYGVGLGSFHALRRVTAPLSNDGQRLGLGACHLQQLGMAGSQTVPKSVSASLQRVTVGIAVFLLLCIVSSVIAGSALGMFGSIGGAINLFLIITCVVWLSLFWLSLKVGSALALASIRPANAAAETIAEEVRHTAPHTLPV